MARHSRPNCFPRRAPADETTPSSTPQSEVTVGYLDTSRELSKGVCLEHERVNHRPLIISIFFNETVLTKQTLQRTPSEVGLADAEVIG